uniref:Biphenyl hydrolase like n=1 Tax=Astyanax mexicanus TaxID=7994 RepID=A0A3B1JM62_ASTMX
MASALRVMLMMHHISVSSGKKSVNGVELYYQQVGEAEHPVLLLTGKESKITDIKPMNRFCGVFGPSRLWMFASPRQSLPLNFFHRDAKDVVNLMHELGFRHFSLLGWSDGGITALIAAALNPTLIKKMVVWGSNAYVSEQDSIDETGSIHRLNKLYMYCPDTKTCEHDCPSFRVCCSSTSATCRYTPWTKYVQTNVCEGCLSTVAIRWEICHLLFCRPAA